jgi:hypothetical protein
MDLKYMILKYSVVFGEKDRIAILTPASGFEPES